jgi:hypothetical protein
MKPSSLTRLVTAGDASPLFRSAYWALERAKAAVRRDEAIQSGKDARAEGLWMDICELRRAEARAEMSSTHRATFA